MSFLLWLVIGLLFGTLGNSLFEWTLHRFVMHKRLKWFIYPFKAHAIVHHHVFKADETYHLMREEDKHTVPMAWWNGPVLILVAQIPFALMGLFLNHWLAFLCGTVLSTSIYYGAYEYIHWCMHVPRKRNLERNGIFFRLNGHHLLHHRYMKKNFNVVLPVADWLLGTLLLRSKVCFAQARGASVPDVQPRAIS